MKLHLALGISSGDVAAFVGAGGKSSAIVTIAGELLEDGTTVLAVPTTKIFVNEGKSTHVDIGWCKIEIPHN